MKSRREASGRKSRPCPVVIRKARRWTNCWKTFAKLSVAWLRSCESRGGSPRRFGFWKFLFEANYGPAALQAFREGGLAPSEKPRQSLYSHQARRGQNHFCAGSWKSRGEAGT